MARQSIETPLTALRTRCRLGLLALSILLIDAPSLRAADTPLPGPKKVSAFFPPALIERARRNAERFDWARTARDGIVKAAEPWLQRSDEELWSYGFGNTIKRSWMVLSNGDCPSCAKPVPMYNWKVDAMARPWKMQCPHCSEFFPKNDFEKFYRSGLDESGVFQFARADRSLLFNTDHPDAGDPKHLFGVDDGEGFVRDGKRWRFVNTYIIYGLWKQAIVGGISKLAAAYTVTGDTRYAHKAAILLDRAADFYPTYDFKKEGVLYEGPGVAGYVSTWHDACAEVQDLTLAYDQMFTGMENDAELVTFLAAKAKQVKLENPKSTLDAIRRNIEGRIFRDTLLNQAKIQSNYPTTEVAKVLIHTILGWPDNRGDVLTHVESLMRTSTAVDGVSGEKGMAGYTTIAPRNVARLAGLYMRADDRFLPDLLQRRLPLLDCFRFHIDTKCLGSYYPQVGDSSRFARRIEHYVGAELARSCNLDPSDWTFLWRLYGQTHDTDLVRVIYKANGESIDGLPYDLFAEDPAALQRQVRRVIEEKGPKIEQRSVNKQGYRLALLRSGEGPSERVLWIDYDSGGRHGHADGMNIGLFAHGLDLMPEFGYPPVHYGGGWNSPQAKWYTISAAHNTVLVDGKNTFTADGETTLWADGRTLRLVRVSCPAMIRGEQFERTVALVELPGDQYYAFDIFRVAGGQSHLKLTRGTFSTLETRGIDPKPAEMTIPGALMRGFRKAAATSDPWSATWSAMDTFKYLPADTHVRMRVTEATRDATPWIADSWISVGLFDTKDEAWIPTTLIERNASQAPLRSTFVSTIETWSQAAPLQSVRRLDLRDAGGAALSDSNVAIETTAADGTKDLILSASTGSSTASRPSATPALEQPDWKLKMKGDLALIRRTGIDGLTLSLCRVSELHVGDLQIRMKKPVDLVEFDVAGEAVTWRTGPREALESIRRGSQELRTAP